MTADEAKQVYKLIYNPIIEDIYLYKNKELAQLSEGYGHKLWFDLKGNILADENKKYPKIGKIIKPRWDKYYQKWQLSESRIKL